MEFFNGKSTIISRPVKGKNGEVLKDQDGHILRKIGFNLNAKLILTLLPIVFLLVKIGIFYAQTADTSKAVTILKSKVDTLQNTVIVNQHAIDQKVALLVRLIDPEHGKEKLKEIDDDKKKLLKELEDKNDKG